MIPVDGGGPNSARDEAIARAGRVLAEVRAAFACPSQHRAVRAVAIAPRRGLYIAALVLALLSLLAYFSQDVLMGWQRLVLTWAMALEIPIGAGTDGRLLEWMQAPAPPAPAGAIGLVTLGAVLLLLMGVARMPDSLTPLKYLAWAVGIMQIASMLLFTLLPGRFSHNIEGHLESVLRSGELVMWCAAALICFAQGLLRASVATMAWQVGVVIAYFMLMIPHKTVLHALALQHLGMLFMPLLYFGFGVLFDVMVLVALFSWLASQTPQERLR